MIFDPTKPVRTRDGRPARILATDLQGEVPIAAAVLSPFDPFEWESTEEVIYRYQDDGRYFPEREAKLDLINIPERTFKFVNVYAGGNLGLSYSSERSADDSGRAASRDRIGLLKIILEGDRLVNVEVV